MDIDGNKHYRTTIRTACVDLLKDKTVAGIRVFPQRVIPYDPDSELPAIAIYTLDGESERTPDGNHLVRSTNLVIEGALQGNEKTIDEDVDTFALEVENAIKTDLRLGGLLSDDLELLRDSIEMDKAGEYLIAGFKLEFKAKWQETWASEDEDGILPSHVYTHPNPTENDVRPEPIQSQFILPTNQCGPDGCDLPFDAGEF